jgi:serine/threonine-protein kinase
VGTVKSRIQGTPDYIAPEQVGRGPLTPATDVFNFGATMYWCCTDHHIPTLIPKKKDKSSVPTAPVNENREPKAPHELNPQIPMPLSRVIMDCVQNRPSHRPQDFTAVIPRLELALTVANVEGPLKRMSKESLVIPDSRDESKDDQVFE